MRAISVSHSGLSGEPQHSVRLVHGIIKTDVGETGPMMLGHFVWTPNAFQAFFCSNSPGPILNAACGDDPNDLAVIFPEVVNMDLEARPRYWEGEQRHAPKNFVPGSIFDPPFADGHFGGVLLGEFLEHATYEAGVAALKQCVRVVNKNGLVGITLPFDGETPGYMRRHPESEENDVVSDGVTVGHQHLWDLHELDRAIDEAGLVAVQGHHLFLLMGHFSCSGVGLICSRRDSEEYPGLHSVKGGGIELVLGAKEARKRDRLWSKT